MFAETPTQENGGLATMSRVQMLWMCHVRGYRLRQTQQVPRMGLFGQVRYKSKWVLERRDA